jgi:hypothetical protein
MIMWKLILKSDFKTVNEPDATFAGIYNTETDTIILNVGALTKIFREGKGVHGLGKDWAEDENLLNVYINNIINILKHETIHEGLEKAGIVDSIMEKFKIPIDLRDSMESVVLKHFFHELYAEILGGTNWNNALKKATEYFDNKLETLSELWKPIFADNPELRQNWHRYGIQINAAGLEMVKGIAKWIENYQAMLLARMEKEIKEEQAKEEVSEEFREKGETWIRRIADFRDI